MDLDAGCWLLDAWIYSGLAMPMPMPMPMLMPVPVIVPCALCFVPFILPCAAFQLFCPRRARPSVGTTGKGKPRKFEVPKKIIWWSIQIQSCSASRLKEAKWH